MKDNQVAKIVFKQMELDKLDIICKEKNTLEDNL